MGGLSETHARVHRPRSIAELSALFASASPSSRKTFSLVGGRHSFADHFFPADGGEAIDTTSLEGTVVPLESDGRGGRWVRASGNTTFEAIADAVAHHLPLHPPTSDLITVAGALAGCTHDVAGFFPANVRRFSVLTPDGTTHDCHAAAEGIAGELFLLVPGSFGTLGVIVDLELRLSAISPTSAAEISVTHRGHGRDDVGVARLEAASSNASIRAGLYFYGLRGTTVLFETRKVDAIDQRRLPRLPLTDDANERNIYLQAMANHVPGLVPLISPLVLRAGRQFRASIYGHAFFQRSYARSYRVLTSSKLAARALAIAGVNPRLPVAHQTFVIPRRAVGPFLDLYFDVLERHRELVARIEQQDLIRLPECVWPLHGSFGMEGGSFLFTSSLSVPRASALDRRAREFFGAVASRAFTELGVKTLLLKQMHGDVELLRSMHADMLARLSTMKAKVDPNGVLSSRFLERLLPSRPVTRTPT